MTYTCVRCSIAKPLDAFPEWRGKRHGSRCYACLNEMAAERRAIQRAQRPVKVQPLRDRDRVSKVCNQCGVDKPVAEFYWATRRWSSKCRVCTLANLREQKAAEHALRPPKPPKPTPPPRIPVTPDQRFWALVDVRGDADCWPWLGTKTSGGYGAYQGTTAHRFAYVLTYGPVPDDVQIHHSCRNEPCVNPRHLAALTRVEHRQLSRASVKPHPRKTHCKRGHAFTPENTMLSKEGWQKCRECNRLWQGGEPTRQRQFAPKPRRSNH